MTWRQQVVVPKTIEEICDVREAVRQQVELAHKTLKGCEHTLAQVAQLAWPFEAHPRLSVAETMREVDRRLWRAAFDKTGLMQYMDRKARTEFENSLDREPPEFKMDAVQTTLLQTAQNAKGMFMRGVVEFFQGLSAEYRTNQAFKIGKRCVMRCAASHWFGTLSVNTYQYSSASSTFNDLDRVFKVLDGKQHNPRELEGRINEAWKAGEWYEDEYYQIKGFKNGNAHILFKRQDLLDQANRIIHDYFDGSALAKERAA